MDTGGRAVVVAAVIGAAGAVVAALIGVGRLFPPGEDQPTSPGTTLVTVSPSKSPSPSASPVTRTMVNVIGKKAGDAQRTLLAAGFTQATFVGEDGKQFDPLKAPSDTAFTVTSQSVASGAHVPVDSRIVITCQRIIIG